uniref:ADAM metallopeptidase domain 15 n=1 Tax=Sarcophilus harrisii TaxID=9305 RepID=A0A7N4Q1K3_SARHA
EKVGSVLPGVRAGVQVGHSLVKSRSVGLGSHAGSRSHPAGGLGGGHSFPRYLGCFGIIHHSSSESVIPTKLTFKDREDAKSKLTQAAKEREETRCSLEVRGDGQELPRLHLLQRRPQGRHCFYHLFGPQELLQSDGGGRPESRKPGAEGERGRQRGAETEALGYVWSHTKYLELFVVVDNRRFLRWGSNVTQTVRAVTDALAHVNTYSRAVGLRVVLVGLEIWTERDQVRVSGDLGDVLRAFNRWRARELARRARHDAAHLIVGAAAGERAGEAFLGGACAPGRAAGVEAFPHEDPAAFAALLAHELGHNLGMSHDHPACLCPDRPSCLMGAPVRLQGGFSNCSLGDFYTFVRPPRGACLYDEPAAAPAPREPRCGDGVVDAGEECDCGDPGACPEAACCLPSCRRRPGAQCAAGPCCRACRLVEAARPCRPSADQCDLPEYCDGASPHCPPDSYKQDGAPCRGEGRCYRGRCRSLRGQCEALFGPGSRAAPPSCYRVLNARGDRFGNCGGGGAGLRQAFVGCEPQHALCGKLLCEHVPRLPRMRKHHTLIQVPLGDTWCWAADLFEGAAGPEGGAVQTGTWCGPRRVCVNRTCSDVGGPRAECEPETTCHGRGVCNNLQHCHCDAGSAPPACEAAGPGGSVDRGPAPEDRPHSLKLLPFSRQSEPLCSLTARLPIGPLPTLVVIALFAVLMCCLVYVLFYRENRVREEEQQGEVLSVIEEEEEEEQEEEEEEEQVLSVLFKSEPILEEEVAESQIDEEEEEQEREEEEKGKKRKRREKGREEY